MDKLHYSQSDLYCFVCQKLDSSIDYQQFLIVLDWIGLKDKTAYSNQEWQTFQQKASSIKLELIQQIQTYRKTQTTVEGFIEASISDSKAIESLVEGLKQQLLEDEEKIVQLFKKTYYGRVIQLSKAGILDHSIRQARKKIVENKSELNIRQLLFQWINKKPQHLIPLKK